MGTRTPSLEGLAVDVSTLQQGFRDQSRQLQNLAGELRQLRAQIWGLMLTTVAGPLAAALLIHHL